MKLSGWMKKQRKTLAALSPGPWYQGGVFINSNKREAECTSEECATFVRSSRTEMERALQIIEHLSSDIDKCALELLEQSFLDTNEDKFWQEGKK